MGTESDGSIIMPAARAGLYALKLTPGSVDTRGLQPGAPEFDCVGPFARTTTDVATLSATMQRHDPGKYLPLSGSWAGLKLGFVDPTLWRSYPSAIEPTDGFFEQTDSAMSAAQEKIESLGGKVVRSIPLASFDEITAAMPDFEYMEELFRKSTDSGLTVGSTHEANDTMHSISLTPGLPPFSTVFRATCSAND